MIAIEVALVGIAIMTTVLAALFGWLHHRDQVHHFIADHDFVAWTDIFRLQGRQFGPDRIGPVCRCYRALAQDVPVELLVEIPPAGHGSPHRPRWILAAQVPRTLAFVATATGIEGTVPQPVHQAVDELRADPRINATLCGHGLFLVRVQKAAGLESALALVAYTVPLLRGYLAR